MISDHTLTRLIGARIDRVGIADLSGEIELFITDKDGDRGVAIIARTGDSIAFDYVDPPGCGCTDCLTGVTRPAWDQTAYERARLEGRAR